MVGSCSQAVLCSLGGKARCSVGVACTGPSDRPASSGSRAEHPSWVQFSWQHLTVVSTDARQGSELWAPSQVPLPGPLPCDLLQPSGMAADQASEALPHSREVCSNSWTELLLECRCPGSL